MPKCWIIEQGEYSDYHVVGIFSTEENAKHVMERIKQTYKYDRPYITERSFDPGIAELNEGLNHYCVRWIDAVMDVAISTDAEDEDCHWDNGHIYMVWAANDQAAIKIAAERHTQYLAQLAGMT